MRKSQGISGIWADEIQQFVPIGAKPESVEKKEGRGRAPGQYRRYYAEKIKAYRARSGLDQIQLSQLVGCTKNAVSNLSLIHI